MIQPRLHASHDAIPRYAIIGLCDMRTGEAVDEATSESHKCMELTPLYGSSVKFSSPSQPKHFFPSPRAY